MDELKGSVCKEISKKYNFLRIMLFISIYVSYVVFYLNRKNISVALSPMGKELGFSNTELGLLGSSLYITYAVGKWISGMVTDNVSVRILQPSALLISGLCNIGLVTSTYIGIPAYYLLMTLAFCWGLNGIAQSGGYTPCVKTIVNWFSKKERTMIWSVWFSSHQTGTWLSVLLSGFVISRLGWQGVFYVPGFIAIIVAIILFITLRDTPESVGLPNIEEYKGNREIESKKNKKKYTTKEYMKIFKEHILTNKYIWYISIASLFLYVVRYGTLDWLVKYMVEVKGYKVSNAAYKLSLMPLFGIIVPTIFGYIVDKFLKGKVVKLGITSLIIVIIGIVGFRYTTGTLELLSIILIGSFVTIPHLFTGGMYATKCVDREVVGAATGFTGMFSNFGSILAGTVTGIVIDKFGWEMATNWWILAAIISIIFSLGLLKHERSN